ncbi:hypothetical protein V8E36_008645 [Tilletia maclaganii]
MYLGRACLLVAAFLGEIACQGPAVLPRSIAGPLAMGGTWTTGAAKAKALIARMTLDEKVNVTTGADGYTCTGNTGAVPRLGLRSLCLNDGPSGVRGALNVSQFASPITVAATWDLELAAQHASAMGAEFAGKGVNIMFAPVSGGPLGRSVLAGRSSEGFGSDEYLHGAMAYAFVKASQASGIVSMLKHWIGYEQESNRGQRHVIPAFQQPVSSNIDDKTLHHMYMWPFAEGVRAGAGAVMCSYNKLNNTHACEHDHALNHLLKDELGFQGSVISDYGAVWSLEDSVNHGLDAQMPGDGGKMLGISVYPNDFGTHGSKLAASVRAGRISEARVDDMVLRILTPVFEYQDLETMPRPAFNPPSLLAPSPDPVNVQEHHYQVVRQVGTESLTLLKNVNERGRGLPLKADRLKRVAVIGRDSISVTSGICDAVGDCERSGTVTCGHGSGFTFPPYVVSPLEAIRNHLKTRPVAIATEADDGNLGKVRAAATGSDAAIVFVTLLQSEGEDRTTLLLDHDGEKLINAVADVNANTIVVVHSPAAVVLESWIDHANVTAVLYAYYPGQESGNGLVPVLFGEHSPSGKLPFVIGKAAGDWPPHTISRSMLNRHPQADFTERTLVDWKWLDTKNIEPRFHFGFGLSYTKFSFGKATIVKHFVPDKTSIQHTNERHARSQSPVITEGASVYDIVMSVVVSVTNTGQVAGSEVAQLYLSYPPGTSDVPAHVLRGFHKVLVQPGQTQKVTFNLRRKDLSIWDVGTQRWSIPRGRFTFFAGGSSGDWDRMSTVTLQL